MKSLGLILWLGAGLSSVYAQPVRAGCDASTPEVAQLTPAYPVDVVSAITGVEQTCYEVVIRQDGKQITGYVLGEGLPAVEAFIRQRENAAMASFEGQDWWARLAASQVKSVTKRDPAAANGKPDMAGVFENFSARDTTGKNISLSGLGGRVTLVTFWAPGSSASIHQLVSIVPLYNEYKRSGLRAIGISADSNASHALAALDDIILGWPQIPDRTGLTKQYGANPRTGTTLVLDGSHHIVAAGLTGAELEQKVRDLLDQP
jgi:peroxiredoxin